MASRDMLYTPEKPVADAELSSADESSFRKMAAEVRRPGLVGVSVFRSPVLSHQPVLNGQVSHQNDPEKALQLAPLNTERVWDSLIKIGLHETFLAGNGVFTDSKQNAASSYFDILRTRLLQAMQERGWRRIAITSPTHDCGKSFVAANLAFSLARRPSSRNVLIDLELRAPRLERLLGLQDIGPLEEYLTGEQPLESHFIRYGQTLALGLNSAPVPHASELLQEPSTLHTLDAMITQLDPQIVVYDVPPLLVSDDVLALLPAVDAVLLVVDGTSTTAEEVKACEKLLEGSCPLMGVVLNRAQDYNLSRYVYGRK